MKIVSTTNTCFFINLSQVWGSPHTWGLGSWAAFGPSPTREPEGPWVSCPLPCQGGLRVWSPGSPAPSPAVGGLRVWSRCFWPVSHCDPRGRLTPPCSPTADKGPWAQAHFGPQVSGVQPGSEAAQQGAWGSLEKPGLGRAPSGLHPRAGVGAPSRPCSGSLLLWATPLVSGVPAAVALSHCEGVACVRGGGAPFCCDYSCLHKYTFLKNKFVIRSE